MLPVGDDGGGILGEVEVEEEGVFVVFVFVLDVEVFAKVEVVHKALKTVAFFDETVKVVLFMSFTWS